MVSATPITKGTTQTSATLPNSGEPGATVPVVARSASMAPLDQCSRPEPKMARAITSMMTPWAVLVKAWAQAPPKPV